MKTPRSSRIFQALLTFPLTGFLAAEAQAQCAMCRTALANSPEGQQLIAAFNTGILFLLAVPLVIFGSVVFMLRRAAQQRASTAKAEASSAWDENLAARDAPFAREKLAAPTGAGETA